MAIFDSYVMVDWSAASRPRQGADSIWICVKDGAAPPRRVNIPTRHAATHWLQRCLGARLRRRRRILVGFDFPFGTPAGFAARLGPSRPPWRALWGAIAERLDDDADNRNNRFEVAAALNRRACGTPFPFWGHHPAHAFSGLGRFRPGGYGDKGPAEMRLSDVRIAGPQPVWKLYGAGSVGGQALTGIPRVRWLRDHPRLAPVTRIWPFETGLRDLGDTDGWRVVIAEVYPSIVAARPEPGRVKDARQVLSVAEHFAALDREGALAPLFAGARDLTAAERRRVAQEEAWILGVS